MFYLNAFYFLLMMIFSFQGLLGAIFQDFRAISSRTTPIKSYRGKNAIIWGAIFFVGFLIIPTMIIVANNYGARHVSNEVFLLLIGFAFIFAWISRDHGPLRVK